MIKLDEQIKRELIRKNLSNEENYNFSYATKDCEIVYENPDIKYENGHNFYNDAYKIINSRAYNRYMGKTQVFFSDMRNDQVSTRALHVQLVSNISRKICKMLSLNVDLAEAIALGHDLGHTPYGHDGERAINNIINKNDRYFRHAVQSVRILRDILKLDISIQVLDGIMCHNGESVEWKYDYETAKDKTVSQFLQEYKSSVFSKDIDKKLIPMTMEGWVVRISDVISYIGKDIEEAISLNIITKEDVPKSATSILGETNEEIVNSLINDLVNNSYGKSTISFTKPVYEALMELREFNYKRIYQNSTVKHEAFNICNMIEIMFNKYLKDIENENKESSIHSYIESRKCDTLTNEEIVIDYIAGMTDDFLEKEYKEYVKPTQLKIDME